MKKAGLSVIGLLLWSSGFLFAQPFSHCSAAFLDNKMVVDDYSPRGKSSIGLNAEGILTVCTAEISPENSKAIAKIVFRIAIRDQDTKTLVMFSDEAFHQVNIQQVLKKCEKGDHIILMTTDDQYALPHNEILVI